MAIPPSSEQVAFVGLEATHVPPAFTLLDVAEQDRPPTACASCPSAIWYKQPDWRCFCNVMKFQAWACEGTPILACDARETSVAKYNAAMAEIDDL